ncbi:MAG: hypothetical protein LQ338_008338, partial [Usnochroma carphineum]
KEPLVEFKPLCFMDILRLSESSPMPNMMVPMPPHRHLDITAAELLAVLSLVVLRIPEGHNDGETCDGDEDDYGGGGGVWHFWGLSDKRVDGWMDMDSKDKKTMISLVDIAKPTIALLSLLFLLLAFTYLLYRTYRHRIPSDAADLELGAVPPHGGDYFQDMEDYEDADELFEIGSLTEDEYLSDDDDEDDESVSSLLPGLRSPLGVIDEEEEVDEEEEMPRVVGKVEILGMDDRGKS